MSKFYCFSHDEKTFHGHHDTIEEAIYDARDIDIESFWIGECTKHKTAGEYFSKGLVEYVLESLQETAYDECGEAAENWLQPPPWPRDYKEGTPGRDHAERQRQIWDDKIKDLHECLVKTVDEWAERHSLQPEFWHVENIQHYTKADAER